MPLRGSANASSRPGKIVPELGSQVVREVRVGHVEPGAGDVVERHRAAPVRVAGGLEVAAGGVLDLLPGRGVGHAHAHHRQSGDRRRPPGRWRSPAPPAQRSPSSSSSSPPRQSLIPSLTRNASHGVPRSPRRLAWSFSLAAVPDRYRRRESPSRAGCRQPRGVRCSTACKRLARLSHRRPLCGALHRFSAEIVPMQRNSGQPVPGTRRFARVRVITLTLLVVFISPAPAAAAWRLPVSGPVSRAFDRRARTRTRAATTAASTLPPHRGRACVRRVRGGWWWRAGSGPAAAWSRCCAARWRATLLPSQQSLRAAVVRSARGPRSARSRGPVPTPASISACGETASGSATSTRSASSRLAGRELRRSAAPREAARAPRRRASRRPDAGRSPPRDRASRAPAAAPLAALRPRRSAISRRGPRGPVSRSRSAGLGIRWRWRRSHELRLGGAAVESAGG